ncbi:MAG: RNA methyltransferase [Planctomycetota bacterium]|nr:RNA methyltransferase [Planctomycetota bacterium]MDA1213847.1 RNA methyltransferase [Planctomycetota bacterium]
MNLELKNPHSALAVLETRPLDVVEVRIQTGSPENAWRDVCRLAEQVGVAVQSGAADQRSGRRQRRHGPATTDGRVGSALAVVRARGETPLESLLHPSNAEDVASPPKHGLWLALDCLQDPHNVGAIFRTAAFFGVKGIIVTRDRSAPLNATVYDVASGGMEYVPFSQPANLSRTLELAKAAGLWILGTSEHAEKDVSAVPLDRNWLLVVGNEEQGLRQLTQQQCDELCRLTPTGEIKSLNASVAAALLMSRLCR